MQLNILRFFDLTIAIIGLIFLAPILLIIIIVGLFDTGLPIFLQKRVGKNMKIFTLIKFRTMHKNTPSVGTHLVNSTSKTKIGDFLRKTKLDELPQLINVVLGHMSLVGPRPCLPNQEELIEERNKRGCYRVPPGITGLAQINEIDMSTPKKLALYDSLMINNINICNYFKLILNTALGKGRGDRVVKPNL